MERDFTNEHIISDALGCDLKLKKCVCRKCNSKYGYSLEASLLNGLEFFRQKFGIKNKKDKIPTTEWSGTINGHQIDFIWDRQKSKGPVMKHPIPLSKRQLPDGRTGRLFRTNSEKQAKRIEKRIKKKDPNASWEQIDFKIFEVEGSYEGELNFLISPQTLRCITKFAFNYYCFTLGKSYAFRPEV